MTNTGQHDFPVSQPKRQALAIPVDLIGIWASTLCVIQYLLTPIVLSFRTEEMVITSTQRTAFDPTIFALN